MDKCSHGADPKSCGEDPKGLLRGVIRLIMPPRKTRKNGKWPGP